MRYITQLPNSESKTAGGYQARSFDAGDLIATSDELSANMYILLSGTVDLVVANAKNQRMIASSLGPGAIFGDGALTNPDPSNLCVQGASSGRVVCLAAGNAHRMIEKYPILGWALLQTYGERQYQIEQYMEDVAYKTLPERLSKLLLEHTDFEDGEIVGLSHQNLADRLGTYRETISAILRTFKEDGMVRLGYRRITIVDADGLMELAGIW
jgi:CRP-like cAMP-binding protein